MEQMDGGDRGSASLTDGREYQIVKTQEALGFFGFDATRFFYFYPFFEVLARLRLFDPENGATC